MSSRRFRFVLVFAVTILSLVRMPQAQDFKKHRSTCYFSQENLGRHVHLDEEEIVALLTALKSELLPWLEAELPLAATHPTAALSTAVAASSSGDRQFKRAGV